VKSHTHTPTAPHAAVLRSNTANEILNEILLSRYYCLTIRRDWPCGLCFVSKVYSAQRKPFAPAACTLSVQAQGCTPHPPGNTQMPEAFGQSPQSLTCWAAIACMRARSAGARLCCLGPPNSPLDGHSCEPRKLQTGKQRVCVSPCSSGGSLRTGRPAHGRAPTAWLRRLLVLLARCGSRCAVRVAPRASALLVPLCLRVVLRAVPVPRACFAGCELSIRLMRWLTRASGGGCMSYGVWI
jgi:hypothetical protein